MSENTTDGFNVSMDFICDLMCACVLRRLKDLGWTKEEAVLAESALARDLKVAVPFLMTEGLASAAAGLSIAGGLTDERLNVVLVALTAIRAIEIADNHNRRCVAQRN